MISPRHTHQKAKGGGSHCFLQVAPASPQQADEPPKSYLVKLPRPAATTQYCHPHLSSSSDAAGGRCDGMTLGLRVVLSQEARFRGSFPTSHQAKWSYPGILEEPNSGRVPLSACIGPSPQPPLRRIAAVAIGGLGPVTRYSDGSGPCMANCKSAHEIHHEPRLLLLPPPSLGRSIGCPPPGGRAWTRRQAARPHPPSEGGHRGAGNADQAPRPLRFETFWISPHGGPDPNTSPLSRPPRFVYDPHHPRCLRAHPALRSRGVTVARTCRTVFRW